MLYGQVAAIGTALEYIARSPTLFYLTGSRFFGQATAESDHDFFTEQNAGIETELENNGFQLETSSYKEDPIITKVYRREKVHVQIVRDVRMKYWVQWCLLPYFRMYKPDKEQARILWTIGTKLYRDGAMEQRKILRDEYPPVEEFSIGKR